VELDRQIEHIITAAIRARIFPGGVVLVGQKGQICHCAAYGTTQYDDAGTQPVHVETIYDVASLTKAFTATVALRLVEEGELDLDRPAAAYLPKARLSGVLVRHLLSHCSGLSLRLSTLREHTPAQIHAALYALDPATPPGTRVAYVNVNSLLLGDIVAEVAGMSLKEAIEEWILRPLEMHNTQFCPPPSLHPRIAPTEVDSDWRGGLVHGTVHDESAYALGGVAGHAGLFSTAHDMWRFIQLWLNEGELDGYRLLRPETVQEATRLQTEGLPLPTEVLGFHCGLGWMMEHPIVMRRTPRDTYGHTGFTGPTIVMLPQCGYAPLGVVLLSNRVYPQRTVPAVHHETTAAVVEAAMAHLGCGA
jgi:CubicO group peptidase (beta-lactamase class C family)